MTPREYQNLTLDTAAYPDKGTGSLLAILYCALGLGEAGEVQGKLKKVMRNDITLEQATEGLLDELGDTLWYVVRMARELGCPFEELMERNAAKLRSRKDRGVIQGSGDAR